MVMPNSFFILFNLKENVNGCQFFESTKLFKIEERKKKV